MMLSTERCISAWPTVWRVVVCHARLTNMRGAAGLLVVMASLILGGCGQSVAPEATNSDGVPSERHAEERQMPQQHVADTDPSVQAARRILAKARRAYASLQSFTCRQTSRISSPIPGPPPPFDGRAHTQVLFKRPDWFRMDAEQRGRGGWSLRQFVAKGGRVTMRTSEVIGEPGAIRYKDESLDEYESLDEATAQLEVIGSRGWIIPALLEFPGFWKKSPLVGDQLWLAGEELIEGAACYRLEGAVGHKGRVSKVTYWIDKDSHLLRRIREESELRGDLPESLARAWQAQGEVGRRHWEEIKKEWQKYQGTKSAQEDLFKEITINAALGDELFRAAE